ncbi:MAG: prepilin-type N-terminal cleavage/methylation domain-containing protein [Desulfobacterales bacterium]
MFKNLIEHPALSVDRLRRREPAGRYANQGFTLLEIMIAIFIFAVIITTIFTSYSSISSGNEIIDQKTDAYEMATNCLNRMILDLKSIYLSLPPGYSPPALGEPPELYRIVGDTVDVDGTAFPRLRFTSFSHISFGEISKSGIAQIVYYVQAEEDGNYVLKRADTLYPYDKLEEKTGDPVLCRNVKSLTFKYYDKDGTEYDLWDSDGEDFGYSTPKTIEIKLELAEGSDSLVFETMVNFPFYRERKD